MSTDRPVEDLDRALTDVRLAYRLVGEYQRRLFSIMRFIVERFPEVQFLYWSPGNWETPPNRGSDPLNKWALDGLPYYTFSNLYVEPVNSRETQALWMLEIHHRADPAVYDEGFRDGIMEPSLTRLAAASESVSELHLIGWLRHEAAKGLDWRRDAWNAYYWTSENDILEFVDDEKFSRIRKRVDLTSVTTRDDLQATVEHFRKTLILNGFPLKAIEPQD